ncbi:FtsX-like permease family protein [Parabacteroides sp. AM08-6]|uniref:FtsX-like permease family protein n=1 Tax=Parabacteroides sp. AM08-6 TaxID=2292053 RepID=UPI000F008C43|nr:FtsX-like permease family protein [Parabacteroides sp. AM08-6]RHJ81813.1 ABC transporter permease [Parabacteroides sp. AM08-6]
MIRQVFIQLWNRRRANAWVVVELLLIFCLLWYITDYFFVLEYNKSIPTCRDLSHTWQVDMGILPEAHPDYQPAESSPEAVDANYDRILDRIRHYEGVEAIAVVNRSCTPGGGSYWGRSYRSVKDTTREANGQMVFFDPRTDFFKVFHYTTSDGKPVSAQDFDWSEPKSMVVSAWGQTILAPDGQIIGMEIENSWSKDGIYVVKGVVGDIKRFDYERLQIAFYKAERANSNNIRNMEIAVRSRETLSDTQFLESFKEAMGRELRIGNFYLKGIQSYSKISLDTDFEFGMTSGIRIRTAMLLFFLFNIMLCVMGTFWYRLRVRREEIGLRMAMGSTRADIRKLLFMEGFALLSVVVLPAMFIEGQFVYAGMIDTLGDNGNHGFVSYLPDRTILRFIITNCLTWLLLGAALVVAIWIPADKASKMAPAEALHYE